MIKSEILQNFSKHAQRKKLPHNFARESANYNFCRRTNGAQLASTKGYCTTSVQSLQKDSKFMSIAWKDGQVSKYHYIWLRDHCKCKFCVEESSGQKLFNPADLPLNIAPTDITLEAAVLRIDWTDGHKGIHNTNWLKNHSYSTSQIRTDYHCSSLSDRITWDAKDLGSVPSVSYQSIMESEYGRFGCLITYLVPGVWKWLKHLHVTGLCLVKGVPVEHNAIIKPVEKISYVRPTMYGSVFDVKSVPQPINIAYTSLKLDLHQDLCYYEVPPGLQFLHCIENMATGGESTFVDGIKAAEILRNTTPELFSILTTTTTTYYKTGVDHTLFYRRPLIVLNEFNDIIHINYSPPFLGPQTHISFNQIELYYAAFQAFTKIIQNNQMIIEFRLNPGDMISFNNRRILHARNGFDSSSGPRHLQGVYVDLDEFYSKYNVFNNKYSVK